MDLPPRNRLITSFQSHFVEQFQQEVMTLSKKRSRLFITFPCWVHYKKMLRVVQTPPAAELCETLPADSALPLITERFIVWQTKTIYLGEKCVLEQRKRRGGCLPNHLKIPERTDEAVLTSFLFQTTGTWLSVCLPEWTTVSMTSDTLYWSEMIQSAIIHPTIIQLPSS